MCVATPRVARDYLVNVGTIASQGLVDVLLRRRRLGTVEEGFIKGLKVGDVFVLGGKVVRLVEAGWQVAKVEAADGERPNVPVWNGGRMALTSGLSGEIGGFRTELNRRLTAEGSTTEDMEGTEVGQKGRKESGEVQLRGRGHSQVQLGNEGEGGHSQVQLGNEGEGGHSQVQLGNEGEGGHSQVQLGSEGEGARSTDGGGDGLTQSPPSRQGREEETATAVDYLVEEWELSAANAQAVVAHFQLQRRFSVVPVDGMLLIERHRERGDERLTHYFFHSLIGRGANDALSRIVAWRVAQRAGGNALVTVDDYGFLLTLNRSQELGVEGWKECFGENRGGGGSADGAERERTGALAVPERGADGG